MSQHTTAALDKRAYTGAPQGFRRSSFPDGEPVLHPSKWNKLHWSFDQLLKTRTKTAKPHVSMTADDSLNLIKSMLKAKMERK